MISLLSPKTPSNWLDNLLERLEGLLFDIGTETDSSTTAFYVYRPYPSSLKSGQLDDWIALQKRTLSPFVNADTYSYAGKKGLCFWASPTKFTGIPETASHASLPDGTHWLKGKTHYYKQQWRQGELVSLGYHNSAPESVEVIAIETLDSSAWAKHRKVDQMAQEPYVWACVALFLFVFGLMINLGSWVGISMQASEYASQAEALEERLSDKLALQASYQTQNTLVNGINGWQDEMGSLPHVLASVASPVLDQTKWNAEALAWQNKVLDVELISSDINITELISSLELREEFESVSIRPHTSPNTWNLQAKLYDVE